MSEHRVIEIFKALSVSSRMHILVLLKSKGPLPVKTIAEELDMTAPAVSQHLKVLRHVGLVRAERQGYWTPHAVDEDALSASCGMMIRICTCGPCHSLHRSHHSSDASGKLRQRRRALLSELERIETELEDLQRKKG